MELLSFEKAPETVFSSSFNSVLLSYLKFQENSLCKKCLSKSWCMECYVCMSSLIRSISASIESEQQVHSINSKIVELNDDDDDSRD